MIRLDPRVPLLWRSPNCVQLGVDPRLVVIDGLTVPEERVLAALVGGATRAALEASARRAGAAPETVARMLNRLRPALAARTPAAHPVRIAIDGGASAAASRLAALLGHGGQTVEPAEDAERQRDRLVLIVGDHVLEPARSSRWLAVDARHLPVVFGDQAVTVGPLVLPGETPCVRCADEYRIDADPAWPALAAELLARAPGATGEDAASLLQTAGLIARAQARLVTGTVTGLERTSIRLDGLTDVVSRRTWTWHDRCACRSVVPISRPSARPRTAIPGARPNGTAAPTTTAVDDVPA